jgi:hypothetical protein
MTVEILTDHMLNVISKEKLLVVNQDWTFIA